MESIFVIRKEELKTTEWSGGTTTQLLIYPEEADYSKRNFKWRLSTANVEVDESVFTSLPGITRILMIINGELFLQHEGQYSKTLKPYDQDTFLGDWITTSKGHVTDFNLMMSQGCTGSMEAIDIENGKIIEETIEVKGLDVTTHVYYVTEGSICISGEGLDCVLNKGDLLCINKNLSLILKNNGEISKLIKTSIFYHK